MNANIATFQALIAQLRDALLEELPERCVVFETQILQLDKAPQDRECFNSLYRGIHSLKGSGGTHGLSIITALCHHLENVLEDAGASGDFGTGFTGEALAYVDLLRRVPAAAAHETHDFTAIEAELSTLRRTALRPRKMGLIVESSVSQAGLYQQVLAALPVQLTAVDEGLAALTQLLHEPFDFIIVGRDLKGLNGIALMAALRLSQTHNSNIPAVLISSRPDAVPAYLGVSAVIARDRHLIDRLTEAVRLMGVSA